MADKRKETAARDENGVRKQTYRRFQEGRDYEPTEAEKTAALCDMFRKGFFDMEEIEGGGAVQRKPGRPRKYESIEEFCDVVGRYIDYIEGRAAEGVRLIPDIEGFCAFAGISRDTLNDWERTRPGEYSDTIKRLKNAIAAYKKQLAMAGKIPPIVFATDFNNNHGYTQVQKLEVTAAKKLDELPEKSDILKRLPLKNASDPADDDIEITPDDLNP